MSSTRLFSIVGASILRSHRKNLSPIHPVRFTRLFISPTLRFNLYSSAAAVDEVTISSTEISGNSPHPWPEWVTFVDRLKNKGYISEKSSTGTVTVDRGGAEISDADGSVTSDGDVYTDMTVLKDACLRFARDRYDIFNSFSRQDIQAVVEKGCPNLFRKAVNTSKRLRVYVGLDEGDVCGGCNLRGSCDKAYVILKESESAARTVDVVRILLLYALDPVLFSGGQKPHGRELIELSARKLLSKLIELSDTVPNPDLPMPASRTIIKTEKSMGLSERTKDVELKRGDWMCPKCNFLNFARNRECRECGDAGPKNAASGNDVEMKKGDWLCPENIRCLKCKAEGPKRVGLDEAVMKKGDWNCPKCSFLNFANNADCLRCRERRPKRELNPGEWECPSCDFLNYRRNLVCKKCNGGRPKETIEAKNEDHLWKRPY